MFEKLKTSLRAQLTVILILIVLVTIILGSLTVISRITPDLKTQQAKHLKMINQVKQNEFRNYLLKHVQLIGLTGHCNLVVDFFKKARAFLNRNNAQAGSFNAAARFQQLFYNNKLNIPYWHDETFYFVESGTGIIFYQSERQSDFGKSVYAADFDQNVLKEVVEKVFRTRATQLSSFTFYKPLGEWVLFLGTPVMTEQQQLLGALVVVLKAQQFNQLLAQNLEMTNDYEFYVTDEHGRLIVHNNALPARSQQTPTLQVADLNSLTAPTRIKDYEQKEVMLVASPLNLPQLVNANFDLFFVTQIEYDTFLAPIHSFIRFIVVLCIFLLILGIILAMFIGKRVVLPIQKINEQLTEFEHGNLAVEIPLLKQKNEFGQLTQNLKRVVERLHDQIRDIMDNINVIASSTNEISATVAQITASSSETATAITQTASSAEEVAHLAEGFNEKAKSSLGIGEEAVEIANKGNQAFESIYKLVQDVKNQMEEVAVTVVDLSKQSQTISEITDAVKEIAEQSNILAINASIEATKAGEYGRGFAVVANEVRNLAEQSKKSTQQIRTILDSIQDAIGKTVMKVEESNKTINTGAKFVEQARSSLFRLAEAIEKLTTVLAEIAEYASEQLTGTAQIKEAMDNIKDATAQNVDSMHQLEEVIQDLKDTGENLKEQISIYKL